MTKIYHTKLESDPSQEMIQRRLALLPLEEQARLLRYRNRSDLFMSLAGKLLLFNSLIDFDLDLNDLKGLRVSSYKKPYIEGYEYLFFSISHSSSIVVIIVSDETITGIDIEQITEVDIGSFTELGKIAGFDKLNNGSVSPKDCFCYWTQLEAVLKANGKGFHSELEAIRFLDNQAHIEGKVWHLYNLNNWDGFCCHYCTSEKLMQPEIIFVKDIFRLRDNN